MFFVGYLDNINCTVHHIFHLLSNNLCDMKDYAFVTILLSSSLKTSSTSPSQSTCIQHFNTLYLMSAQNNYPPKVVGKK